MAEQKENCDKPPTLKMWRKKIKSSDCYKTQKLNDNKTQKLEL